MYILTPLYLAVTTIYYDNEFADVTRPLFDLIYAGTITPLLSDVLIAELANAPAQVRALLTTVLPYGERLPITSAAIHLQEAYLRNAAVSAKYIDDALHVAQATVARAQVLTSWNFKHMLHPKRMMLFNATNLTEGFGFLIIMSPFDVTKSLEESRDEYE